MGDAAMKESDLEAVAVYVKKHIAEWIKESNIIPFSSGRISPEYEISLSERIVRVEEGIKHQGEVLEKLINQIDKRFDQVDKRFEEIRFDMNKRFNQMFAYFYYCILSFFGLFITVYPVIR